MENQPGSNLPKPNNTRQVLQDVVTNGDIPADVRLPALQTLAKQPGGLIDAEYLVLLRLVENLSSEELRLVRGNESLPAQFGQLLLTLVSTCRSPGLRQECIATLRKLLLNTEGLNKLSSALPVEQDKLERLPVAKRLRQLIKNPSAVQADILRDDLIAIRDRQIRDVLRTQPLIREAFAVIAQSSPVLRDLLARRREFYLTPEGEFKSPELGFEATRRFTAAFTAACSTDEGRDLVRVATDAANRLARDEFWSAIKNDPQYSVPELIVGSGPSSVNWRSTMRTLNPNRPSVVIDAQGYAGGQFASLLDPVFALNSRARPFGSIIRENLPGTESPLNTLGPYCAVQESDLSAAVYGDQTNIGLAIEINHLLAGGVACNIALTRWNTFKVEDGKKRFIIELKRTDTGEIGRVQADRLVFARGLGSPKCAFRATGKPQSSSKNGDTRSSPENINRIIEEELVNSKEGRFARYRSFPQFLCDIGNRSNPFPLRDIGTVAVIGAGDSGNVTVEALLGYGPFQSAAPQELDRVRGVAWYGQESLTKEAFEKCTRNRYAPLANDFPRATNSAADYRIEPLPLKAKGLARAEDGRLAVTDESGTTRTYDLVIDCSGFEQPEVADYFDPDLSLGETVPADNPLAASDILGNDRVEFELPAPYEIEPTLKALVSRGLGAELTKFASQTSYCARVSYANLADYSSENFVLCIEGAPDDSPVVFRKGNAIETWRGRLPLLTSRVSANSNNVAECLGSGASLGTLNELQEDTVSRRLLLFSDRPPQLIQRTAQAISTPKLPPSSAKASLKAVEYNGTLNGEAVSLAAGFRDIPLYIIGPEAKLKISEAEQKRLQVNFIAENIVAVFLYSGRITTLAELVADTDRKLFGYTSQRSISQKQETKFIEFRPTEYDLKDTGFLEPTPAVNRLLGKTVSPRTVVETFVRYGFRGCFPDSDRDLQVNLRLQVVQGSKRLSISTSHPFAERIDRDPVFARACYLLLTQPPFRASASDNQLSITVPVRRNVGAEASRFQFLWGRATHRNMSGQVTGKRIEIKIKIQDDEPSTTRKRA